MNWDLTPLFANYDEVDTTLKGCKKRAKKFANKYKGSISTLKSDEFNKALGSYEDIIEELSRVLSYVFLQFATDSSKGSVMAKYELECNKIEEDLLFFELEFGKLDSKTQKKFIKKAGVRSYYLQNLAESKKHMLSLQEERILLKKEPVSSSAFSRLFDEHLSTLWFDFKGQKLSEEQVLSKLHDSKRDIRKSAAKSLTKGLEPHTKLLGYILNQVKKDWAIECDIRNYSSAEEPRHKANRITQKSVDALIDSVNSKMPLVHRYYEAKKRLLRIKELYEYDRYAPIRQKSRDYSFETSRDIVVDVFGNFKKEFGTIAQKAFDEKWIDAYPKEGKRGGAFSHSTVPSVHPYILLNHTDQRRDIFPLAHELGHALHQYFSREVGALSADTPLTTAETASVFAEMMLFDSMSESMDRGELLGFYAGKLEDIFATVFRQIVFTNFERRVHASTDELSVEEFSSIWYEENVKMFGESVTLSEDYKIWWSYIPHFVHSPFYCYAYAFGELLVLALYRIYKDGMSDFEKRYKNFLKSGGSKSPKELIAFFGYDIEDVHFWDIGLREVESMLEKFLELSNA
ncbi:MAG: M3 family oligoendopeptidase [Campylobacterales bacterium]